MATTTVDLQPFAREYAVAIDGCTILITRYTNHRRVIPDGGWVACWIAGPTNPWYLGADGLWRYKTYDTFPTAEAAAEAALRYPPSDEANRDG